MNNNYEEINFIKENFKVAKQDDKVKKVRKIKKTKKTVLVDDHKTSVLTTKNINMNLQFWFVLGGPRINGYANFLKAEIVDNIANIKFKIINNTLLQFSPILIL